MPLDDGARRGIDPWRELDGVVFCHWDRWLLEVERTSMWLQAKAFRRVWHAASFSYTAAMHRTPRNLLAQRARSGHWNAFPLSPAPYVDQLRAAIGDGWHDYRTTWLAVELFEATAQRPLARASTDDERLAIRRAVLTAGIDAIERIHDSDGEFGRQFREHERAYLALVRGCV